MFGIDRRLVQNFDWTLLGLIAVLAAMGIVNLYSATHGADGLSDEVQRQLVSLGRRNRTLLVRETLAW